MGERVIDIYQEVADEAGLTRDQVKYHCYMLLYGHNAGDLPTTPEDLVDYLKNGLKS